MGTVQKLYVDCRPRAICLMGNSFARPWANELPIGSRRRFREAAPMILRPFCSIPPFAAVKRRFAISLIPLLFLTFAACSSDSSPPADASVADGSVPVIGGMEGGTGVNLDAMSTAPDGSEADATVLPICAGSSCGNGTCLESPNGASCVCKPHFVGEACSECARGYSGRDCGTCVSGYVSNGNGGCAVDPCSELGCMNGAECESLAAGPSCACPPQWRGDKCERCAAGYTGAACTQCLPGFERRDLQCTPAVCFQKDCGQGTCKDMNGQGVCECKTGYTGADCKACAKGYTQGRSATSCVLALPPVMASTVVHLDADAPTTMDLTVDSQVNLWRSLHKSTVTFSNAGFAYRPTYNSRSRGVVFDNKALVALGDLFANRAAYTVYVVARWNTLVKGPQVFLKTYDPATKFAGVELDVLGTDAVFRHKAPPAAVGGDTITGPTLAGASGRRLFIAKRGPFLNAIAHSISDGNTQQTVSAQQPALLTPSLTMLGAASNSFVLNSFDGTLHEMVIFGDALSAAENQAVLDYLRVKWAL
jgi:hypothetical protein